MMNKDLAIGKVARPLRRRRRRSAITSLRGRFIAAGA
jgi:hypothetical protein